MREKALIVGYSIPIGLLAGMGAVAISSYLDASIWLILSASLVILLISLRMMQKATNILNIRHLTISGFFYIIYLLVIFFPSFFAFFRHEGLYRYTFLLAVESVLLTVPLGILAANLLCKFRTVEIRSFFLRPIEEPNPSLHFRVVFVLFLMTALFGVFLYLREVSTVPIFYALKHPGDYYQLVQLREEGFKLLNTPVIYLYQWLRVLIFPLLILLSLGYYLRSRQRRWLLLFVVSLAFGIVYAGLSLAKMPVAAIVFMIFLFIYVYRSGRVGKAFITISLPLIVAFPIFVILLVQHGMGVGFSDALNAVLRRVFYDPSNDLYYYFEIFPDKVDYLYGRSIGKFAWLTGMEYFDTANYVFRYMFPQGLQTGLANVAFIGDLHADFGIPGVFIGAFFTGFLMQVIQIFLLRRRKTILNLAIYTFLIFAFSLLVQIPLSVVLLSNGVIVALVLPWVIRGTEGFLRGAVNRGEWTLAR